MGGYIKSIVNLKAAADTYKLGTLILKKKWNKMPNKIDFILPEIRGTQMLKVKNKSGSILI